MQSTKCILIMGVPVSFDELIQLLEDFYPDRVEDLTSLIESENYQDELTLNNYRLHWLRHGPFEELYDGGIHLPCGLFVHGCINRFQNNRVNTFVAEGNVAIVGIYLGYRELLTDCRCPPFILPHPSQLSRTLNSLDDSCRMIVQYALDFVDSEEYYEKSLFNRNSVPTFEAFDKIINRIKDGDEWDLFDKPHQVFCVTQ